MHASIMQQIATYIHSMQSCVILICTVAEFVFYIIIYSLNLKKIIRKYIILMNILFQIRTVMYSIREGLELVTRKLAKTPFPS